MEKLERKEMGIEQGKNKEYESPPTPPMPEEDYLQEHLWEPRVAQTKDGQLTEVGIKDPEGNYYEFKKGEKFSMDKTGAKGREPMIALPDGKKITFREWVEQYNETEKQNSNALSEADRKRLNNIIKMGSERGARFGMEVILDDSDRSVISMVTKLARKKLEPAIQSDEYRQFDKILADLTKKGLNLGISKHIIDGGNSPKVELRAYGPHNLPEIVVPTDVYNTYRWLEIIDDVEMAIILSKQKGTLTTYLTSALTSLAKLVKS